MHRSATSRPVRSLLLSAIVACAAPVLCTQRTIVVDASGQGDHTDLPPAVAVARDGDTILVRQGIYSGAQIVGKGLLVLGEPGAQVVPAPTVGQSYACLRVQNLPAGSRVHVAGLTYRDVILFPLYDKRFVEVVDCKGPVLLSGLKASGGGIGVETRRCSLVTLQGCDFRDMLGLLAAAADTVVANCRFEGRHAIAHPRGARDSTLACFALSNSTMAISGSTLIGGGGDSFFGLYVKNASPALWVDDHSIVTIGGLGHEVRAGPTTCQNCLPIAAVHGSGTLVHDPSIRFVAVGTNPIGGKVTAIAKPMSAITGTPAGPGGTLVLNMLAPAGHVLEVYLSLPVAPVASPIAGTGTLWFDPTAFVVVGRFVSPANGTTTLRIPVPGVAALRGQGIVFQAVSGTTSPGLSIHFGAPAAFVLH